MNVHGRTDYGAGQGMPVSPVLLASPGLSRRSLAASGASLRLWRTLAAICLLVVLLNIPVMLYVILYHNPKVYADAELTSGEIYLRGSLLPANMSERQINEVLGRHKILHHADPGQ